MAAPAGNNNAGKARLWNAAIHRALEAKTRREGIEALDRVAAKLIAMAEEGDLEAIKVLGDRLDGKPAQAITGTDGGPFEVGVRWLSKKE